MTRFRSKSLEVEAWQYTKAAAGEEDDLTRAWPQWLLKAVADGTVETHRQGLGVLYVKTLSGVVTMVHGEWLIRGVLNTLHVCTADIFEATYDPID